MISRKYKCIFIHIPKCAGTSIERSLDLHQNGVIRGSQDHRRAISLERSIWPPSRGKFNAIEFAHYVKQRSYAWKRGYPVPTKSEWESFYKFSVVRNPWDRVFSWYRNVIRDPIHRRNFGVADNCTFDEFLDSNLDCWALDPQLDWVKNSNGEIVTDYVGGFENLTDTYAHIRRQLDLSQTELPKLLKSKSVNYREQYSDVNRRRVAEKYAEEIEMFNYEFA